MWVPFLSLFPVSDSSLLLSQPSGHLAIPFLVLPNISIPKLLCSQPLTCSLSIVVSCCWILCSIFSSAIYWISFLSVQCPWGSTPHPYSRCSMPPDGQAWVLWANQSGSWPTTLRSKSQRWMCITMKWTLSPTSVHAESTGRMWFCHYASKLTHIHKCKGNWKIVW